MGFFGGGSTTYVSSVVYNLAGDETKRPNFLRSTIAGNVIGDSGSSIGEALNKAYLGGPGTQFRNFPGWSQTSGYNDLIGLVTGTIQSGDTINSANLAAQIPHAAGDTVQLLTASIGLADFSYWAEQYVAANHPDRYDTAWTADFDRVTGLITITYVDESTESFAPAGYDVNQRYLYAGYQVLHPTVTDPVVPGDTVPLGSGEPFPDVSAWTTVSFTTTPRTVDLETDVHTVVSYSDGRPDETSDSSSTDTAAYSETHGVYTKTQFMGVLPTDQNYTYSIASTQYQDQTGAAVAGTPVVTVTTEDLGGGVTKTTTTTTTAQTLQITRTYRTDTQETRQQVVGATQIFIYGYQTGNAVLDVMFAHPSDMGTFYPFIPMRLNNRFVSDSYLPDVYVMAKKAFKRATGGKYDDVIAKVADNDKLSDIDYTYAVYGVALNVLENASKKYIYQFFKFLLESDLTSAVAYTQWKTDTERAATAMLAFWDWYQTAEGTPSAYDPPVTYPYPPQPNYSVRISSDNRPVMDFDMRIHWMGVEENSGSGVKKAGAKAGDFWFVINASDEVHVYTIQGTTGDHGTGKYLADTPVIVEHVTLFWQETANSWRSLDLWGLKHQNFIYGGKSVDISAVEALNDADESGFIIPLHEAIYKSMSLKDGTQMSTACVFLVFNCYQVVKKKWYQTGLFTVIVIIIIIVITIVTWGTGTGPAISAYGAIGAAIGLTGLAAVIAGLVISMVASMILMKIIGAVARAAFGDKVGSIVGAIATVVIMVVGSAYLGGADWTTAVSSLTEPQNLAQLTSAVGQGISQYQQAELAQIEKQTQDMLAQYNTQMKQVSDLYAQNIGIEGGTVNPLDLTDSTVSSFRPEPPSVFLNRTLMTGSDIAELTATLISEYTTLTLDLNQNLVT